MELPAPCTALLTVTVTPPGPDTQEVWPGLGAPLGQQAGWQSRQCWGWRGARRGRGGNESWGWSSGATSVHGPLSAFQDEDGSLSVPR